MIWPDRRAWLFSAKTFAAVVLALYVSLRLGLQRPYWAMATCYVVAQPWSGMARAKGFFRLAGTLAGAAGAILLVPNLANAPPLLAGALALWVALCLTASLLMHAPQSYAFMLAGYTAAIIGFPAVNQPDATFTVAVSRVLEIGTGVVSVLLIDNIFPVSSSNHVLNQMGRALADLSRLASDVLAMRAAPATLHAEQLQVARDNTALGALLANLRYEPPSGNGVRDWVPVLHMRLRPMPLLLASVADRLAALRQHDADGLARLTPLLRSIEQWLACSAAAQADHTDEAALLRRRIAAAARREPGTDWPSLLRQGLLSRLDALVTAWADALDARRAIGTHARPGPEDQEFAAVWPPAHMDSVLLLQSFLAVFTALAAVCAIWIATAWPDGASAASIAAIGATLFVHQDNAGQAVGQFFLGALPGIALVALYNFAIFPILPTGFVPLVIVLAFAFLPIGAMQGTPALFGWAIPLTLIGSVTLGITAQRTTDFAAFANASLATLAGLAIAQVSVALLRPAGVAWRLERLARADRADIARAARGALAVRADLVGAMLDRFDAVAARIRPGSPRLDGPHAPGSMDGLRIALNVMELRFLLASLPAELAARVDLLLRRVARLLESRIEEAALPAARLQVALDTALEHAVAAAQPKAALALAGLRRALLPHAPAPCITAPAGAPALEHAA